jgi:5-methyltetrahydropteroyltriglutamate--homocysteine methyltransferase
MTLDLMSIGDVLLTGRGRIKGGLSMAHILTTHAGSLPRPKTLVHMLAAKAGGEEVSADALEREVEAASSAVIAKQIEAGVDIINDGEAGRESFFTYVRERMTGFGGQSVRPVMRDIVMYPSFMQHMLSVIAARQSVSLMAPPQAVGDVVYKDDRAITAECARLKRLLSGLRQMPAGAFMTAASPGIVAAAMENRHYASLTDYIAALGRALSVEYRSIVNHGFTLQIDAPDLAMERHTLFADKPLEEFLAFSRAVVAAINAAIEGLPREKVRLHVCWGNYNGPHECDEPIESLWPVLETAKVGGYVISLANPRHEHEIAFFQAGRLPKNSTLIAGVIDTTTNYVEHPKLVAERIVRAVEAVGDSSRVVAGTDCGFETSAGYVNVAEEVVWAKLRALSEGARLASAQLARRESRLPIPP